MALLCPSKNLVEDVKRIVLNHISLPVDLQALCLVSKDWNFVATEGLYNKIILNIHTRNGRYKAFEDCLQRGALRHLRHVRSLNLYDTSLYSQSDLYDTSLYQQSNDYRDRNSVQEQPSQNDIITRQEVILRILHQLPENKLHTFRYISCYDLASSCIQYLSHHQQFIRDLHVTQCDPRLLVNNNRQNLTAGFCNKDHKTIVFAEFAKAIPQLDSVWFNFLPGWTRDVARYWDPSEQTERPLAGHTIRSRTLSMSGYMPLGFTLDIPHMFDLSMMTSLVLNDFNLYVLMDTLVPANALCNLVHFRCTSLDALLPEHVSNLQSFFERNAHLKHVQMSLVGLSDYPSHLAEAGTTKFVDPTSLLWSLRQQLQSLAWYDPQRTISDDSDSRVLMGYLSPSSLQSLSRNLPCLQQLGLKAPDQPNTFVIEHIGWKEHLLTYLEPLMNFKDLRMLQLYQEHLRPTQGGNSQSEDQIASDIQGFATFFFQWAHTQQPHLSVLVWGTHGLPAEIDLLIAVELGEGNFEYVPQLFFVKRVERNHDRVDLVYASTTTRDRLRDEFAYLSMLTYDPGFRELDRQAIHM